MAKYPYYSGMESKKYWALRSQESLSESFVLTDEVANYSHNLYNKNLNILIGRYVDIMSPYMKGDELDIGALTKARTYDLNFLAQIQRLNEEIIQMSKTISNSEQERLFGALKKVYINNVNNIYTSFGKEIKSTYLFNPSVVESAIKTPWTKDGREFSQRIWHNTENMNIHLRETISNAVMNGESIQKSVKKFKEIMSNTDYNTSRIIRTETLATHTRSSIKTYEEMGLKKLKIISEASACDVCKEMSSKPVEVENAVVGVNIPPAHPFCKCCVAPLVDTKNW